MAVTDDRSRQMIQMHRHTGDTDTRTHMTGIDGDPVTAIAREI